MRIIEISVNNLFGVFNHTIPLKIEDRVTIIHGPNGFGKTILLKILAGLFSGQYSELRNIPFNRFQVKFDDDSVVWVEKKIEPVPTQLSLIEIENGIERRVRRRPEPSQVITVNFIKSNAVEVESFELDVTTEVFGTSPSALSSMIEVMIPEMERVGPTEWVNHLTGEMMSTGEILERFGNRFPVEVSGRPEWWVEIQESINIRLVEAQRLMSFRADRRRRIPQMVPTVVEYAEELAGTIERKLAESAALFQSLDRTFPVRLVEQMGHSELTEDQLRRKLGDLEKKRSRLGEVGLLDKEEVAFLPPRELSGSAKDVLDVYVQDVEKKLSVFDEIAGKIELFKQIINNRFLYKQISISKQSGFSFTTTDGKSLPVTTLSSGEQHELVLLYQLLFKADPNSLILIDEPELSLHVAWQKQFLRDLQEIARLASLDVLIATHSPQIIHDRWDLTIELTGPEVS